MGAEEEAEDDVLAAGMTHYMGGCGGIKAVALQSHADKRIASRWHDAVKFSLMKKDALKKLLIHPRTALYLGRGYALLTVLLAVAYVRAQLRGQVHDSGYGSYRMIEFIINLSPFLLVAFGFYGSRAQHLPLGFRKVCMVVFWLAGALVALLCVPGGIAALFHVRLLGVLPAVIILGLLYSHTKTQRYRHGGTLMP